MHGAEAIFRATEHTDLTAQQHNSPTAPTLQQTQLPKNPTEDYHLGMLYNFTRSKMLAHVYF